MTAYEITLPEDTANFEISTVINDENMIIKIRTLENIAVMDLTINNNVIFKGLRCDANVSLTDSFKYKGVKGDLAFFSSGTGQVNYKGFGTTYRLFYVLEDDE